jgi:hypothetical protein
MLGGICAQAQLASHSTLVPSSTRAKAIKLSPHAMMAPSQLSSSFHRARSCSCSSTITAEEGTSEGTKALHQSASKVQHHDEEASPDKHRLGVTHQGTGEAQLKEVPDLMRWVTIVVRPHVAGASTIMTPTSHYRHRSRASFKINGGEGRPSSKLAEDLRSKVNNSTPCYLYC